MRHIGSWKLILHIVKQANVSHPILCSGIMEDRKLIVYIFGYIFDSPNLHTYYPTGTR